MTESKSETVGKGLYRAEAYPLVNDMMSPRSAMGRTFVGRMLLLERVSYRPIDM